MFINKFFEKSFTSFAQVLSWAKGREFDSRKISKRPDKKRTKFYRSKGLLKVGVKPAREPAEHRVPVGRVGLFGRDVLAAALQQPGHDGHQVDEVDSVLLEVAGWKSNLVVEKTWKI